MIQFLAAGMREYYSTPLDSALLTLRVSGRQPVAWDEQREYCLFSASAEDSKFFINSPLFALVLYTAPSHHYPPARLPA